MKLKEIAQRLNAHLQRWEADPESTMRAYPASWAIDKVGIIYVYQNAQYYISKADALAFLHWIEAGNVGHHWKMRREQNDTAIETVLQRIAKEQQP